MKHYMEENGYVASGVPSWMVDAAAVLYQREIEKAAGRSDGSHTAEDLLDACRRQECQLWTVAKAGEPLAALFTQIAVYPRRKMCMILGIGGRDLRGCVRFVPLLKAWAEAQGCHGFECWVSRDAIVRRLPGWRKVFSVVRHDFGGAE